MERGCRNEDWAWLEFWEKCLVGKGGLLRACRDTLLFCLRTM